MSVKCELPADQKRQTKETACRISDEKHVSDSRNNAEHDTSRQGTQRRRRRRMGQPAGHTTSSCRPDDRAVQARPSRSSPATPETAQIRLIQRPQQAWRRSAAIPMRLLIAGATKRQLYTVIEAGSRPIPRCASSASRHSKLYCFESVLCSLRRVRHSSLLQKCYQSYRSIESLKVSHSSFSSPSSML